MTKLNCSGNGLVYSTYLGGDYRDYSCGIAVDADGNAYVTGETWSSDFPTQEAYQTDQGLADAFVTKLSEVNGCDCEPGECDGASPIDILDIVHLIDYKFKECPPGAGEGTCPPPMPYPVCSGDLDLGCQVNILDIVYLIDYKFKSGPPPPTCMAWATACGWPPSE